MLPLEVLTKLRHLVTHENCPDGVASAMIIKDAIPEIKVTFVNYNTKELAELEPEAGMVFCDFAPPRDRVQDFVDAGVVCLDHHRASKDIVSAFGPLGVFADEDDNPGVSGAVLAYEQVWKPLVLSRGNNDALSSDVVREFAVVAGIRDTFQKKDSRWRQACEQAETLMFYPEDLLLGLPSQQWPLLVEKSHPDVKIGTLLFDRRLKGAKRAADNGYRFVTRAGTRAVVFDNVRASSDAADYLGAKADIVVGFSTRATDGKPTVTFSTRSHTDFDCAKFCKQMGGGGHTRAAGFTVNLDTSVQKLSWFDRFFFHYRYNIPPGRVAVHPTKVHPFYLFESLLRRYEGEV